jgi:hypothetical protein
MEATEILKLIRDTLDQHPDIGATTQILYCPDKMQYKVSFGILEKIGEGSYKRFTVTVDDTLKK